MNQSGQRDRHLNVVTAWDGAMAQAVEQGHVEYPLDPADVARLTPLGYPTINLDGRYRTTSRPPTTGLRPLRTNPVPILITDR